MAWVRENGAKQCRKCKAVVEKLPDGCNHVTCMGCDFVFCFFCLFKYVHPKETRELTEEDCKCMRDSRKAMETMDNVLDADDGNENDLPPELYEDIALQA